jgi:hypothetical protein
MPSIALLQTSSFTFIKLRCVDRTTDSGGCAPHAASHRWDGAVIKSDTGGHLAGLAQAPGFGLEGWSRFAVGAICQAVSG